jgi:ribosome-binding factor A
MVNPRTIARLEARIQERAAYCLQFEVNDPRASFITVTKVELSPDVTSGKIHYSVLGTEGDKSKAEHMLKSAAGFIQRQVARVLDMRRVPHLRWVYDGSMELASNMDKLIREARERDRAINPSLAAEPEASPAKSASARGSEQAVDGSSDADDLHDRIDGEIDADSDEDSGDDTDETGDTESTEKKL